MTAGSPIHEFLAELRDKDVKLSVEEGQLRCNAPTGVLTPQMQDRLRERKGELIAFLQAIQGNGAALPRIQGISRPARLPLSYAQEGAWFIDQMQPGTAFNIPLSLRLLGKLDISLLQQTLDKVVDRHEALRTTFMSVDGQPSQVVADRLRTPLLFVDLSETPAAKRNRDLLSRVIEIGSQPFDLSEGPLLRMAVFKLDADDYVIALVIHHIVFDGHSVGIFARDFATCYEQIRTKRHLPLPVLPVQYADYAVWQRETLRGEFLQTQLDYWREKLANYPSGLNLVADRRRDGTELFHGGTKTTTIDKQTSAKLRELAQREGVTLFMLLLAAFKCLLARYTGQEDLIVGTPIANRSQEEMADVIGFCVNMLALRTDLSGNPPFRDILHRVRDTCVGAYGHQELPFGLLVQHMRPDRHLSHSPFFSVGFALQHATHGMKSIEFPDLKISSMYDLVAQEVEEELAKHQAELTPATDLLYLDVVDTGAEITAVMQHSSDLFTPDLIGRMMRHFERLAEGIVADPTMRLFEIPLMDAVEGQRVLLEWNSSGAQLVTDGNLQQLFQSRAAETPDAIAVVVPSQPGEDAPDDQLTYGQLNRRANQLARFLLASGVDPESRIGICMERSCEMLVAVWGVLKAGAAFVPLDVTHGVDRLTMMLDDSQAGSVLTHKGVLDDSLNAARVVDLDHQRERIARHSDTNLDLAVDDRQLAYIIFTSGSTGRPKGVMVQHSSLVNAYYAWAHAYQLDALSCHLQMASFSFDVFVGDMVRALCSGAKLVLCPRESLLMADELCELVRRYNVDCAEFVPTVVRGLAEYLDRESNVTENGTDVLDSPVEKLTQSDKLSCDKPGRLDSLQVMLVGSDSWYASEYEQIQRLVGTQVRLINSYGVAEATIDSTYYERAGDVSGDSLVPIGRPFANSRCYVLDAYLNPVPVGAAGELYIGGAGLARGYCDRPDLTAERFVPDPFSVSPDDRLYRTGDRTRYLPGGNVEFLGRVDQQIKIRGFRIEPGEVEAALAEHTNVAEVIVIAHGEASGEKRLVAYLSKGDSADLDERKVRAFLTEKLPEYMVPSAFIILDEFPLTPSGKLDRRSLPDPAGIRPDLSREYVAPRTPTEVELARIWSEVLDIERVGINDSFFVLGGHSLLAAKLIARVRTGLQWNMPLRALFERPTIAALAQFLDSERQAGDLQLLPPEVVTVQPRGSKPPLFLLHAVDGNVAAYMDLVRYFDDEQPVFGLQHPGLLDAEDIELTLEELAARYMQVIRSVQPQGPYLLAGWSLGGVLAYELARQLDEQKCEIGLVVLIDSRTWTAEAVEQAATHSREQAERQFGLSVESFLKMSKDEQVDLVLDHAKAATGAQDDLTLIKQLAVELGLPVDQLLFVLEESIPAEHSDQWSKFLRRAQKQFGTITEDRREQLHRQLCVVRNLMKGLGAYRPQPYRGPIVLLRADQSTDDDIVQSWQQLVDGAVTVHVCPGHHFSILREPCAREVAKVVNLSIEAALTTASGHESAKGLPS